MLFSDEIKMLADNFGKHQKGKGVPDEEKNQVNVMAYLSSNEILLCPFNIPKYCIKIKL